MTDGKKRPGPPQDIANEAATERNPQLFRLQSLNGMHSTELAALCGEVAASAFAPDVKDTGLKLLQEWNQLQIPAMHNRQAVELLQSKRRDLRYRMINFLISL